MKEKYLRTNFFHQGRAVGFKSDQVRLPNGKDATREYLTHPGAGAVVPFLDSPKKKKLNDCRVAMVKQFRYPVKELTLEIPAGKLDKKESVRQNILRELKEETGYSTRKIYPLISYHPTPAFSNEVIHIYWTDDLRPGKNNPDDDEFLAPAIVKFGELLKKVQTGKIRDSKTVIAVLACATFLGSLH